MGSKLLNVFVLVWLQQYLLRRISPEEYAVYPVVAGVMLFAPVLTSVLTAGLGRYAVHAYSRGDSEGVTRIVSSIFPLNLAFSALFCLGGLFFAWNVGHVLTIVPERITDARIMMALLVVSHAFEVCMLPLSFGLYIRQRFVLLNGIFMCREVLKITLLFVLLLGVSTRVLWVVVASSIANSVAAAVVVVLSLRMVPEIRIRRGYFDLRTASSLISFGLWSMIGYLGFRLRTTAPTLVLNKMATPIDVNSFYLGTMPDRHVHTFTRAAAEPILPMLTAMDSTGDEEGLRKAFLRGNRLFLWAALAPVAPLIIFAHELVDLYVGQKYSAAAGVIAFIYLGYGFLYACGMLHGLSVAKARIHQVTIASLFTQIGSVLLTIYFVGPLDLGAPGAALATLIGTVSSSVLVFWPMGLKMADVSLPRFFRETIVRGVLPIVPTVGVCLLLRAWMVPGSWSVMGAFGAISLAVYGAMLLGVCASEEDRKDLKEIWKRVTGKFRR